MNPANNRKIDAAATLACLSVLVFWTTGPIFIKYLTGFVDLWTQNLLRYSAACLFWLPFLFVNIKQKQLEPRIWQKALWPAVINIIMQTLGISALYFLEPAFMTLLLKSTIIWIAGFSLMFFPEERCLVKSNRFRLGIVLSSVGVVGVLVCKEDFAARKTMTGIVLVLASAFMWAAYTIWAKIAFKNIDSRRGFSVITIYTVAGLAVLALIEGDVQACLKMSVWPWLCVVISGITSIALSHVLYYFSIKRIGATIPAIILLATPFFVLAMSNLFFKETLSGMQWLFGLILLVGCGLAVWAQGHLK